MAGARRIRPLTESGRESLDLLIAVVAGVLSAAMTAAVIHSPSVPLFSGIRVSVGLAAGVLGAVFGGAAFVVSYLGVLGPMSGGILRLAVVRRVLDTAALTLTHIGIYLVSSVGGFVLLQRGFRGLSIDLLSSAVLVGVTVAVATFFMRSSAQTITAARLSTLLSVFIVTGTLSSMITAPVPDWWRSSFSYLGTMPGFSGIAFTFTVIATGALIAALADYLAADIRRWASTRPDARPVRAALVGWAFVSIGVALAGVGVFPVDRFPIPHDISAIGLVVLFFALVIGMRWWLPGFPRSFFAIGYAFLGAIVLVAVLFFPVRYYTLTAVEVVAFSAILGWIVLFIRTLGALNAENGGVAPHALR